jgi:DDE superfamily endonuclease
MTKRLPVSQAPGPLEDYCARFDDLFGARAQREGFRRYLEGLLLPAERNKTLTALANTEPVAGAQRKEAQSLQWFLSESGWAPKQVNEHRLELLLEESATAPDEKGVLVIDEHGDRKWGKHTAHVGRQWLANIGKTDNGVVSVSSLWADEGVYYPLEVEPYTPSHHFEGGKNDPRFRTKLKIAGELVGRAVEKGISFRAVVADSFYGEDEELRWTLKDLGMGYVLALKPSHGWWHREGQEIGALWEAALGAGWEGPSSPGAWARVERRFRDGHTEEWWTLEVEAGPYGPEKSQRAVVVTTEPGKLPERKTWYLVTNLPHPSCSERSTEGDLATADLAEVVRLYGLRMWVEQSFKQVKHVLGWSDYQVRSDLAIRRHWQLVLCAFSFCWWAYGHLPTDDPAKTEDNDTPAQSAGRGKKEAPGVLAGDLEGCTGVAGALGNAVAILEGILADAPATGARNVA